MHTQLAEIFQKTRLLAKTFHLWTIGHTAQTARLVNWVNFRPSVSQSWPVWRLPIFMFVTSIFGLPLIEKCSLIDRLYVGLVGLFFQFKSIKSSAAERVTSVPSQQKIRQDITNRIVTALESNLLPWCRPWSISPNAGRPANAVSKRAYSGVNSLLLELHRLRHDLRSRWWDTFRQWSDAGCTVKKRPAGVKSGQWGCSIVFCRPITKTIEKNGEEVEESGGLGRVRVAADEDRQAALDFGDVMMGSWPPFNVWYSDLLRVAYSWKLSRYEVESIPRDFYVWCFS